MKTANKILREKRVKAKLGGGAVRIKKQHGKGKLSARERIEILLENIEKDHIGIDIGEKTVQEFSHILYNSETVFWNGPMGIFEQERFCFGTKEMAEIVSNLPAYTIVGGGDSVSAISKFSNIEKFNHVSTGGGASLEYLEGKELPGVNIYPPLII